MGGSSTGEVTRQEARQFRMTRTQRRREGFVLLVLLITGAGAVCLAGFVTHDEASGAAIAGTVFGAGLATLAVMSWLAPDDNR